VRSEGIGIIGLKGRQSISSQDEDLRVEGTRSFLDTGRRWISGQNGQLLYYQTLGHGIIEFVKVGKKSTDTGNLSIMPSHYLSRRATVS
jgi:hypothetical protein